MTDSKPTCTICGHPMGPHEQMFRFHGSDGGKCPEPPVFKKSTACVAEYVFRDMHNGEFWLDVVVDRKPHGSVGPFKSETERQRAHDDLTSMLRSMGAVDTVMQ